MVAAAEVKEAVVEEEETSMFKVFTATAMEEGEGIVEVEGTILVGGGNPGDVELVVVVTLTVAIQQRLEIALSAVSVFQLPKLYQQHHQNHALLSMARQQLLPPSPGLTQQLITYQ